MANLLQVARISFLLTLLFLHTILFAKPQIEHYLEVRYVSLSWTELSKMKEKMAIQKQQQGRVSVEESTEDLKSVPPPMVIIDYWSKAHEKKTFEKMTFNR